MLMFVYYPEPVQYALALVKMWIEQIATVQDAQMRLASKFVEPYVDAFKRDRIQYNMRRLRLQVVANPRAVYLGPGRKSEAKLSVVRER
jgi:hypothetical protein